MTESIMLKLAGTGAYQAPYRMSPPPSERLPHVIQFEMTTGCNWNNCGYCDMYKGERYHEKSFDEFMEHVDAVWNNLREVDPEAASHLTRIFIGGGNALAADTGELNRAVLYAIKTFRREVGMLPKRVAVYGNTRDILKKGESTASEYRSDLQYLDCGGACGQCSIDIVGQKNALGLVYWGIESGSSEVLKLANAGYDGGDVIKAGEYINATKIRTSVMIIPGLGGKRFSDAHVDDTAKALNAIKPKFVTFIGLDVKEISPYAIKIEEDPGNRPLTPPETVEQTADIIEFLDFPTTIGVHGKDIHDLVGRNPVSIGSRRIYGYRDAERAAEDLRRDARRML